MRREPATPAGERSRYVMFGAEISYYSGKLRCYLRHKGIPFVERQATGWIYLSLLPRRVGAAVVPVVLTPEGERLQDTSAIIDELERRFPEPSVLPATPVQRFVAYLFELWGDELVWMAQRLLAVYAAMSEGQRVRVREWLASVGGEVVLQLDLPRMKRVGMSAMRLAEDPAPRR